MAISVKTVLATAAAAALLGGCATGPYYQDGYGYGPGYYNGYGPAYYSPGYLEPSVGLGITYIDRDDNRRWRGDRDWDGRRDGRRDRDGRDDRNDWRDRGGDRDRGGGRDSRGDHGQNSPG